MRLRPTKPFNRFKLIEWLYWTNIWTNNLSENSTKSFINQLTKVTVWMATIGGGGIEMFGWIIKIDVVNEIILKLIKRRR